MGYFILRMDGLIINVNIKETINNQADDREKKRRKTMRESLNMAGERYGVLDTSRVQKTLLMQIWLQWTSWWVI